MNFKLYTQRIILGVQFLLGMAASENRRELLSFFFAGAAFPIRYDTSFYLTTELIYTLKFGFCLLFCIFELMMKENFVQT